MTKIFKVKCEFCGYKGFIHSRKHLILSRMKELKDKLCYCCRKKGGLYILDEYF